MAERPIPPADGDKADAKNLFGDEPGKTSRAGSAPSSSVPGPADSYDLEEVEESPSRPAPAPIPPVPAKNVANPVKKKTSPEPERKARPALDPSDAVEEVWSRWGEWGPTVIRMGIAALVVMVLLYFSVAYEKGFLTLLIFLGGGAAMILLSYPLVVTLERPVRMTPEQAVRDYFAALAHHFPQYRRMWLLLSSAGKTSTSFASFEGFQDYWKAELDRLRGGKASKTTPLKFAILDFRSEKAAGQPAIDVKYTLEISIRGQTDAGPVEKLRVETSLARGPDRMWYLDDGTLPRPKV